MEIELKIKQENIVSRVRNCNFSTRSYSDNINSLGFRQVAGAEIPFGTNALCSVKLVARRMAILTHPRCRSDLATTSIDS